MLSLSHVALVVFMQVVDRWLVINVNSPSDGNFFGMLVLGLSQSCRSGICEANDFSALIPAVNGTCSEPPTNVLKGRSGASYALAWIAMTFAVAQIVVAVVSFVRSGYLTMLLATGLSVVAFVVHVVVGIVAYDTYTKVMFCGATPCDYSRAYFGGKSDVKCSSDFGLSFGLWVIGLCFALFSIVVGALVCVFGRMEEQQQQQRVEAIKPSETPAEVDSTGVYRATDTVPYGEDAPPTDAAAPFDTAAAASDGRADDAAPYGGGEEPSSPAVAGPTAGSVAPDGYDFWDDASSMWYSHVSGYYWDPRSGRFYDPALGDFLD